MTVIARFEVPVSFDRAGDGGQHDVVVVENPGEVDDVRRGWEKSGDILVVLIPTADTSVFDVRWFSPFGEIELCGSGAFAAAHVIFNELGEQRKVVSLRGLHHTVKASPTGTAIRIRLPVFTLERFQPSDKLLGALHIGAPKVAVVSRDLRTAVLRVEDVDLARVDPNQGQLKGSGDAGIEALIITAAGNRVGSFDFRYFTPWHGLDESPIAISATSLLGPFWNERLGTSSLVGRQLSQFGPSFRLDVEADGTWVQSVASGRW